MHYLLLLFVCLLVGLTNAYGDLPEVPNKMCPVLTDEAVDPNISIEYEGKRVYFCCAKCRKKFLADPGQYLSNLLQATLPSGDTGKPKKTPAPAKEAGSHPHEKTLSGAAKLIHFMGKFHPLVVHFPIALILAAALAEALLLLTRQIFLAYVARFNVGLGAISAIAAVLLGLANAAFGSFPAELAEVLMIHRWLGITTACLTAAAFALSESYWRKQNTTCRLFYRIVLFVAALMVGVTGHFGGTLIYGVDYYKW
jgi:uncharacterized membrane protein